MKRFTCIVLSILGVVTMSAQPYESVTYKAFNLNLYHYPPNSPDTKYTRLPVWDSPVMIMDKEAIDMMVPGKDMEGILKDFNTEM